MNFPRPLVPGTLIRRWKRFLCEVRLDTGDVVRAHCPNPGAMLGLNEPGMRVWLEPNDDPRKKLDWGWRLAELPGGHWAGIDTSVPNRVVAEALAEGRVPGLTGHETIRPEVSYGAGSRIDFVLSGGQPDTYVEVKNVHLRRTGDWAEFPDSVTTRGAKHLRELSAMVALGRRAVMLYLVQRTDCARVRLAADLDPAYAAEFARAQAAGVEVMALGTTISLRGVKAAGVLPFDPRPAA